METLLWLLLIVRALRRVVPHFLGLIFAVALMGFFAGMIPPLFAVLVPVAMGLGLAQGLKEQLSNKGGDDEHNRHRRD